MPEANPSEERAVKPAQRGVGDIMAHQLKFIACMKILMEELSTLATGFEVDGGQLRFQLYIWLEQEVEVLKKLCNYSQFTASVTSAVPDSKSCSGLSACPWSFMADAKHHGLHRRLAHE